MDYYMYFCADCKKVYKVQGKGKKVKCTVCKQIISDLDISYEEWDKLNKGEREEIKQGNTLKRESVKCPAVDVFEPDLLEQNAATNKLDDEGHNSQTLTIQTDKNKPLKNEESLKNCPQCGAPILGEPDFCVECGRSFKPVTAKESIAQRNSFFADVSYEKADYTTADTQNNNVKYNNNKNNNVKRGNTLKTGLIVLLAIVVSFCAMAGIQVFFKHSNILPSSLHFGFGTKDKKVKAIIDEIDSLGEISLDDFATMSSIEDEYNKLTSAQKSEVTNYDDFKALEEKLLELIENKSSQEPDDSVLKACFSLKKVTISPDDFKVIKVRYTDFVSYNDYTEFTGAPDTEIRIFEISCQGKGKSGEDAQSDLYGIMFKDYSFGYEGKNDSLNPYIEKARNKADADGIYKEYPDVDFINLCMNYSDKSINFEKSVDYSKRNTKQSVEKKKNNTSTEKPISDNAQESLNDEPIIDDEESDDLLVKFGIDKNTYEDYSENLLPDEYLFYDSGMGQFKFSYPAHLFNDVTVNDSSFTTEYGTNKETITFTGSGGSELSYAMYARTGNESYASLTDSLARNEYSKYYDMTDIVNSSDDEKGRIVMAGFKDTSEQKRVYDLIEIEGDVVYRMLFVKPTYKTEEERLQYSYVVENVYRMCGFSGSSKAARSYNEFIESNP